MTYFVRNIAKLFLEQPFCWLIILLGLGVTGITALPSSACCYDPPDYDGTSVQGETPLADQPGEVDQNSAAAPERPEEAQTMLYSAEPSNEQGQSSAASGAENFLLIRRYMSDGQYLRAKQMAERGSRPALLITSFGDCWRPFTARWGCKTKLGQRQIMPN